MSQKGEILATYSPCCGMVRPGVQTPGVMHTGMCRERNGGSLGPTIYLMESYRVPREPQHCPTCDCPTPSGMAEPDPEANRVLYENFERLQRR